MSFYAQMQAEAAGIFKQFTQGQVIHRRLGAGAGTPQNPGVGTATDTTLDGATVSGVTARELLNSHIVASDLVVRFAANQIAEVRPTDLFVIDGVPHRTMNVETKPAAGTPVAHIVVVRA